MIKVNISLYGSLARFGGGKHVAQMDVELPDGSGKADLLGQLGIPEEERGYLFLNAMLCEVPGLSTGANESLKNGDHIGVFSVDRLYPYQYRDGLPMSDGLKEALKKHGAMHHSYK
ncbi:MAG: MoaD/ThiS family protein [Chloroflexota bacterium]